MAIEQYRLSGATFSYFWEKLNIWIFKMGNRLIHSFGKLYGQANQICDSWATSLQLLNLLLEQRLLVATLPHSLGGIYHFKTICLDFCMCISVWGFVGSPPLDSLEPALPTRMSVWKKLKHPSPVIFNVWLRTSYINIPASLHLRWDNLRWGWQVF